jgi:hypothetical protein
MSAAETLPTPEGDAQNLQPVECYVPYHALQIIFVIQ